MAFIWASAFVVSGLISASAQQDAASAQAKSIFNQSVEEMSTAETNRAMSELEAEGIEKSTRDQTTLIKRKAAEMRGQIVNIQGGSGVVVGEGSAQTTLDVVDQLSTADMLVAMYDGIDRAVFTRTQGKFGADRAGRSLTSAIDSAQGVLSAGTSGANATLFSSALGAASRYYGPKMAKTGT